MQLLPGRNIAPFANFSNPGVRVSRPRLAADRVGAALLLACSLCLSAAVYAWELHSYASINEDASLLISGNTIHLAGVHIPETERTCKTSIRPPVCGSRAKVALEFKIDRFVRCEILSRNRDQSLNGRCFVDSGYFDQGEDLAAYLLERGWAVALPNAPIDYQTLEKIARARGFGIWGIPVDNITR